MYRFPKYECDGGKCYHLLSNKWRETTNFIDKAWCMRTQKLYSKQ